jgi:tripartite-type tricarboxylate transporter receptor subunit TctC
MAMRSAAQWSAVVAVAVLALLAGACGAPGAAPAAAPAAGRAAPAGRATVAPLPTGPAAGTAEQPSAVASFYQGKTVTLVVGLSAGGGYDIVARLLAPYLGKYLPGNPNVIVDNRTGAGGLVAANLVYKAAPKDGTSVLAASENLVANQLLGAPGVEYDFRRFQWLGSVQAATVVCYARADAGVRTFADALARPEPLIVGATAPGSNSYDFPATLQRVLGANFRIITGYGGSAPIRLAMESGEVQAHCVPWESVVEGVQPWLDSGFAVVFVQQARDKPAELATVSQAEDFARTASDRSVVRLLTAPNAFSKPYAVAPEVPAERVAALREGFAQALRDPELLEKAQRARIDISPKTGPEVLGLIQEMFAADAETVGRLKEIVQ